MHDEIFQVELHGVYHSSNKSRKLDLIQGQFLYEPISIFVGREQYYDTIKRTAELLERLLPLIDDATMTAYGRVFNHKR